MIRRTLITAGLIAATALGAGIAQAAPDVTSVEVNRMGKKGAIEVVVEAARGTKTVKPTIRATIAGRTRVAKALNWSTSTSPTATVTYVARFPRPKGMGRVASVSIEACDSTGCATTLQDVTVVRSTPTTKRSIRDGALPPLPANAVNATTAIAIALATVGNGSTLVKVKRGDKRGAVWKVKVLRADGARVKVYVAANGDVLAVRVQTNRADKGDHPRDRAPAPLPPGSITPDQAIATALAYTGAGSRLLSLETKDGRQVAYEVKVISANGTVLKIKIAANGSIVSRRSVVSTDRAPSGGSRGGEVR